MVEFYSKNDFNFDYFDLINFVTNKKVNNQEELVENFLGYSAYILYKSYKKELEQAPKEKGEPRWSYLEKLNKKYENIIYPLKNIEKDLKTIEVNLKDEFKSKIQYYFSNRKNYNIYHSIEDVLCEYNETEFDGFSRDDIDDVNIDDIYAMLFYKFNLKKYKIIKDQYQIIIKGKVIDIFIRKEIDYEEDDIYYDDEEKFYKIRYEKVSYIVALVPQKVRVYEVDENNYQDFSFEEEERLFMVFAYNNLAEDEMRNIEYYVPIGGFKALFLKNDIRYNIFNFFKHNSYILDQSIDSDYIFEYKRKVLFENYEDSGEFPNVFFVIDHY